MPYLFYLKLIVFKKAIDLKMTYKPYHYTKWKVCLSGEVR